MVSSHIGDHLTEAFCLPAGQVSLCLENGSFRNNQAGRAILNFCIDWYGFPLKTEKVQ